MQHAFQVCFHREPHVHIYGTYEDRSCCAAGNCAIEQPTCGAPDRTIHDVVLHERANVARGLPLVLLPADVLRHVLAPYLGALASYALRSTCRALRRVLPAPHQRTDPWRLHVWMDACATGTVETLVWLHARVPLPTEPTVTVLVQLVAALRDQVPMLCWLAQRGLHAHQLPAHMDRVLAASGCVNTLRYILGSCPDMRQRIDSYDISLACAAAYRGRLVLLRWLHTSGVQPMNEVALERARVRGHAACIAYIEQCCKQARQAAYISHYE